MNVGIGNEAAQLNSGNICFEFLVQCVCSGALCLFNNTQYGMDENNF